MENSCMLCLRLVYNNDDYDTSLSGVSRIWSRRVLNYYIHINHTHYLLTTPEIFIIIITVRKAIT